jgi:fermentation-respiration switch protein FrsA (DUF1100 family)
MDDGVHLAATLYTPTAAAPAGGWPAIVLFHAIGGDRQSVAPVAEAFADRFVVLAFDARGYGGSGGLVTLDGPREIQDTREVYDWLAAQPNVDSKHIGAWGISLGGGAVLRSLVDGVPWAAAEVLETWTDLYSALAPQNLTKSGAIYGFLSDVPAGRLDPSVAALQADAIASTNLGVLKQWADERSSRALLSKVTTPIYFFQGRRDFAFDLSQAAAGYRVVKGPKRLYFGDFGHSPSTFPARDISFVESEGRNWFLRYLAGQKATVHGPVTLAANPWNGKPLSMKRLPATRSLKVTFGGSNAVTGLGKAQRTSGALHTKIETFGAGLVRVPAKLSGGWARVVAVLSAKPPKGKTIVVSEGGVNTVSLTGAHTLAIRLIADATLIPRGSKLTLTLASSSTAQNAGNLLYLDLPMAPTAKLTLGPARLTLPVLKKPISR